MQEFKGKSGHGIIYVYEGYTYHIDKRLNNTYRCSTRRSTKCRGMVIITEDGEIQVNHSHDHSRNDMAVRLFQLRQEMYYRCQKTLEPLKKIFDDVCGKDPEAAVQLSYPMLKTTLHRKRIAYKPTIPNTFESLALELENYNGCGDTYKGNVIAEDGTMALLFSCDELFQALNDSAEIFVDGTFAVVPRKPMAAQLYTVHIRYMDTGIATVFVLCESRTKALYRAMWKKIIEFMPSLQQNVKFIMGDYEKSAIAALHEVFPNASIHGCWFHYNQAILRKWRQLGLTNAPDTLIRMAMSLPLIPHTLFNEAFVILQEIADGICDSNPTVLQFMSYMRSTWLQISKKVSVFNCPVRTNNIVESFHNAALKHFQHKHTNIWIFIDNLRKLIVTQKIDLGRVKNNLQVRRARSKINRENNDAIIRKQKDLIQHRISLAEFLKSTNRLNENRIYLLNLTSEVTTNEKDTDETCADLLSESLTIDDEQYTNESCSNNTKTRRRYRSRKTAKTHISVGNVESIECNNSDNQTVPETTENRRENHVFPELFHYCIDEIFNIIEEDNIHCEQDKLCTPTENMSNPVQQISPKFSAGMEKKDFQGKCKICLLSKADQIIIPCGHVCMCSNCATNTKITAYSNNNVCPCCTRQIENIIRVIPT